MKKFTSALFVLAISFFVCMSVSASQINNADAGIQSDTIVFSALYEKAVLPVLQVASVLETVNEKPRPQSSFSFEKSIRINTAKHTDSVPYEVGWRS